MTEEVKTPRTPEEVAAFVKRAEASTEKLQAEAAKARAEARKAEAEALEAECDAQTARIVSDKAIEEETRRKAGDRFHHRYVFDGQVTGASVEKCIAELTTWHRLGPSCDITIVFNSPGGEVISGMNLFDHIRYLRAKGHHITTVCMGYAASMAGILMQAGDKRVMGRESYLLIHEVSFMAAGSMGDVEDTVEWVKKVQERVLDIFAERSTMSRASIKKKWTRKDWWLSSTEALKAGFVDEIA